MNSSNLWKERTVPLLAPQLYWFVITRTIGEGNGPGFEEDAAGMILPRRTIQKGLQEFRQILPGTAGRNSKSPKSINRFTLPIGKRWPAAAEEGRLRRSK